MSFLALDIGNSSVKAAAWDGAWSEAVRWPSDDADGSEWARRLKPFASVDRAGVASVVPRLGERIVDAVRQSLGVEAVRVSAELPLPFRMAYATPATLGADRLAAAVAAHSLAGGRGVVALDAGTAITTEAISAEPAYLGGAIVPGPDLLRRALARDTGQLPDVPWPHAPSPVGSSTVEAIQAGLATLVVDGVSGLLRRTTEALGGDALVVATGGWAPWLAEHIPEIDRVEPLLVLEGIRLLTDR